MIINVRGTSGSGKSTLVRRIMGLYPSREAQTVPGRRQPISYLLTRPDGPGLMVPGHYEIECGGCDTVKTTDQVLAMALTAARAPSPGCDVLMEGLLLSENVGKVVAMRDAARELDKYAVHPVLVIRLNTPVEDCLAAVRDRRARRGDTRPLNSSNTSRRVDVIVRACARLRDAGVPVEALDREAALRRVCSLLRLSPPEDACPSPASA